MTKEQYDTLHAAPLDGLAQIYAGVWRDNSPALVREFILNDRFFLLTQVLDVAPAWHPWVLARCREVEADPDEHLDLWSRGHFKSTIITYAGVAQYILANPEKTVCIMSYKAGAAEAFASQIKTAFEKNDILAKCFPDVLWTDRPDRRGDQWTVSDFTVRRKTNRKEASVSTSGLVTGMRTGGHYDLLVYDDTVTPESVTTPEQIRKTTDAWSMSLNLGTLDGTRHWYIGTRYALYDTYYEMLKTGTIKERRHVCIDKDGKPVLLPQAEFDKKKAEMTSKDWASQMMQTPVGDGELLMKEEWMHAYRRLPEIPMNYYILADTAQKQTNASDYTVMWVVGLGADRRYYWADLVRDKLTQSQRCAKLFELVEKWRPVTVFYEENAAPDDPAYIRDEMARRGHFDLKPFRQKSNSGPKAQRIETLEPLYRAGLMWLPEALRYRQYDGSWRDLVQDFLRDEFLSYPQVVHDDMLDAQASMGNADVKPFMEFPTFKTAPRFAAPEQARLDALAARTDDDLFAR